MTLDEVNAERRRRKLPPLTTEEARRAYEDRYGDGSVFGSQAMDFMFAYMTGVPVFSAGGIMGFAAHPSETSHDSSPSYSAPSCPRSDSGSSSSSYDNGSSSSSDSGNSSPSDSGGV